MKEITIGLTFARNDRGEITLFDKHKSEEGVISATTLARVDHPPTHRLFTGEILDSTPADRVLGTAEELPQKEGEEVEIGIISPYRPGAVVMVAAYVGNDLGKPVIGLVPTGGREIVLLILEDEIEEEINKGLRGINFDLENEILGGAPPADL